MSAERGPLSRRSAGLRAPGVGIGAGSLVLGLGALLLLGGRAPEAGRPGEDGEGRDPDRTPHLCGEEHPGSGETRPLELSRVERTFLELRVRVERKLSGAPAFAGLGPGRPCASELPACRGGALRTEALPASRGLPWRGRVLVFLAAPSPEQVQIPSGLPRDPGAEVLLLQVRALQDLPGIERRLGRPVHLAPAELARALGVRCVPTWIRITEAGDAGELHEGD